MFFFAFNNQNSHVAAGGGLERVVEATRAHPPERLGRLLRGVVALVGVLEVTVDGEQRAELGDRRAGAARREHDLVEGRVAPRTPPDLGLERQLIRGQAGVRVERHLRPQPQVAVLAAPAPEAVAAEANFGARAQAQLADISKYISKKNHTLMVRRFFSKFT